MMKEWYNCFECIYLQTKKCNKCTDIKSYFVPVLMEDVNEI